ncbi:hypothetical protein SHJG_2277 [Streptomyces hygroscopicus subsp. jinggangensis 5008]|nr:hypothetical protein SHJG_2277 [Streptomyces hygroscopicus subsp. jinggangensis 5008]AGF61708.1 hypothetical protein SHJGH_2042 [Streptomyces hygroscopicus subsp. jinggangensis TL01]
MQLVAQPPDGDTCHSVPTSMYTPCARPPPKDVPVCPSSA